MMSGIGGIMDPSRTALMRSQMGNPFKKLDADGNGSLDEAEIGSMAEKISEISGKSVDAGQIISKLDSDGDGQINQEEFDSGRPKGPLPAMMGMMGRGMMGNPIQSFLDAMEESEGDESSGSEDSLDTNGDGVVDTEEIMLGMKKQIQEYQNQVTSGLQQGGENKSQLDLIA
jgi:Ca2+-binding EF-hand superfamily protein